MNGQCFFSRSRASHASDDMPFIVGVIDVIDEGTGRGHYGGESLDDVRSRYKDVEVVSFEVANRRIEDAIIRGPREVDVDRFDYLLNVLPPCRWTRRGDTESFYVSERITGSVVTWGVRIGERYFELRERTCWSHQDVIASCETFLQREALLSTTAAAWSLS